MRRPRRNLQGSPHSQAYRRRLKLSLEAFWSWVNKASYEDRQVPVTRWDAAVANRLLVEFTQQKYDLGLPLSIGVHAILGVQTCCSHLRRELKRAGESVASRQYEPVSRRVPLPRRLLELWVTAAVIQGLV